MRRPLVLAALCALLGVLGCAALFRQTASIMPSYLAIWLFWIALPLGALPIVMTADLFGAAGMFLDILRRMLWLMIPASLLAIPLMLRLPELFNRPDGLPASWMAPHAFITRMVVMLIVWCLLAVLFSAPSRTGRRTNLAMIGLLLHVCMGSLAAIDWVLSLQPGLASSAFGLLLISGQMAIAASAALLVLALQSPNLVPTQARTVLACTLGLWVFVHLTQYLVIWSANLPNEIVWYQLRTTDLGTPVIWTTATCTLLALLLLPATLSRLPGVAASCAAMLLIVHLLAMLWLVTPVFRDGFRLTLQDGLAVLGLGGLAAALLIIARPPQQTARISHEPA